MGLIIAIIGLLLQGWWSSVTNQRRPGNSRRIFQKYPWIIIIGYLFWYLIIALGFIFLFLNYNILVTLISGIIFILIIKFSRNNSSLESQINWVFKMYFQEKESSRNNEKNDEEIMKITAKRYLSTMNWEGRYYLFEENPPEDIKDLASRLMRCVSDVWVDPKNYHEYMNFLGEVEEKVKSIYKKYPH